MNDTNAQSPTLPENLRLCTDGTYEHVYDEYLCAKVVKGKGIKVYVICNETVDLGWAKDLQEAGSIMEDYISAGMEDMYDDVGQCMDNDVDLWYTSRELADDWNTYDHLDDVG